MAFHLGGEEYAARQITYVAPSLGWRDEALQASIIAKDVQISNTRDAADRLDSLARAIDQPSAIFPLIDNLLTIPKFRLEIAKRLYREPSWRLAYLTQISDLEEAAMRARLRLALALPRKNPEQVRKELTPFANWMFHHGDVHNSYELWHRRIAEPSLFLSAPLFDPEFRSVGTSQATTPFDWNLHSLTGATAIADQDHGKLGLSVLTDGTVDGDLLDQALVLARGAHSFSIKIKAESSTASDAFRWRILCGPQRYSLSQRDGSRNEQPSLGQIVVNFTVPPTDCPYEILSLSLSRTPIPSDVSLFFSEAVVE